MNSNDGKLSQTQIFKPLIELVFIILFSLPIYGSLNKETENIFPGADQNTPSRSHFFDWINSQYEGTTEKQTLTNLDFFKWLHDEYGMQLDVYSLDVGNIDDGAYTAGVGRLIPYHYGTMESDEFKDQFPRGFAPLVEKAASFGCRLGIWLGPDGFGNTPEEQKKRTDMLISFCRDYNFMLFKIDGVAGGIRPEKEQTLVDAVKICRTYCPDLIILNERINFKKMLPYITTSLWEGVETYIDVFMWNNQTAAHHRVGSLARELAPNMTRLIEDHGVCFSSCLDYWEDEFVLQAFNRCLMMAPQYYGNPWFLRDEEFPKLARLSNLHRCNREILVEGIILPVKQYGPYAVSRGDDTTRFITLRNLTWNNIQYSLQLDETIGLKKSTKVEVRRFHPSECILGQFNWDSTVTIDVLPFRTCLIMVSSKPVEEVGVIGCDYEVIRDVPNKPVIVKLLGMPGTEANIRLSPGERLFKSAKLNDKKCDDFLVGQEMQIKFPGPSLKESYHRKIGDLKSCRVPDDAEALYEATCFSADNNALEVRAVQRSGPSRIPQVIASREEFFDKKMFINRGIWDKNLFDGDIDTFFTARMEDKAFRIDFGEQIHIDKLVFKIRDRQSPNLSPEYHSFAEDTTAQVSSDLKKWISLNPFWRGKGTIAIAKIPQDAPVRYVRIQGAPRSMAEIEAYRNGKMLDRSKWRASNLFDTYSKRSAISAWSMSFVLKEIPENGVLAVAIDGKHGNEGAYAALRVDGELIGSPDRSVSYPSNTWEYYNVEMDNNYTYYFPLSDYMRDKKIDVVVLILKDGVNEVKPTAWITAYPIPFKSHQLILSEAE